MSALALTAAVLGGCAQSAPEKLPGLESPIQQPSNATGSAILQGVISAPGGPYIYDLDGRVVFLHGVNAVYKRAPYELYDDPGKPWDFTAADASLMATLGFNVVRLGLTWSGLEPGTAPSNDPAICGRGAPRDPGQYNQAVVDTYLTKLAQTVALLGRYRIYTILDMHQDVYNEMFDGEGAPNWAVCTDGVADTEAPGRWSQNYGTPAAGIAYNHFWNNDVVGDLQGEYDRVWAAVATAFRSNPWVAGYDPFNEPFSTSLVSGADEQFDRTVECFYTGTRFLGLPADGSPKITCPAGDPPSGVIPRILAADPTHLVFYETDIYATRGHSNFVGPMNFSHLVFNVHVYCTQRNPQTGNPTNLNACVTQGQQILTGRAEDRGELSAPAQPQGPAWIVTEFGATSDTAILQHFTAQADQSLVGWAYWSWKYYNDPTGSAAEALLDHDGNLKASARILSRTYPEAVAGRPTTVTFDPATAAFHLIYTPDQSVHAPTLIIVPTQVHYPNGYCANVTGGTVTSAPGSGTLEVANSPTATLVHVNVTAGTCTGR